MIADTLELSSQQVEVAIRYIEEHRDEVMANYERSMERIRRGNPPEHQAKIDAIRGTARAKLEELVLITGNRNDDGADSLEATIRNENQPDSLPVITIADQDRVLQDRLSAERVAESLLDYLL